MKYVPNILSIFRLFCAIAIVILLFLASTHHQDVFYYAHASTKKQALFFSAAGLFAFGSFTDFLDGYIARKHQVVSDFGKFIDPVTDKVLVNLSALILALFYPGMFPWYILVIFLLRDFIIDGLRLVLASKKVVLAAGIWGKAKTFIQLIAILLIFFALPFIKESSAWYWLALIPLFLAAFFSIFSGGIYLYEASNQYFTHKK